MQISSLIFCIRYIRNILLYNSIYNYARFAFFGFIWYNIKVLSLQNIQNHLDTPVFPSSKDWKSFEYLLDTIDHIIIEKLSRQEYTERSADIYEIIQKEDVSYGRLSMPEDITHGELLFFIDFLTQKFGIESYSKLDDILTKVKILIGICLREDGSSSQWLQNLAAKYHLDANFIQRITDHRLRPDISSRSFVRELRRDTEGRVVWVVHIKAGSQKLAKTLKQEFSFNFLRRGLEIVRMGMMTMTQEEQAWIDTSNNNIKLHVNTQSLDSEAQLLRKKIGIDQFKRELDNVRRDWDEAKIEEVELRAANRLIEVLYDYPYQLTKNKHGYKLSKMIDTKELFCVGYSLLWHAFLSELWIWHQVLDNIFHSAIIISQTSSRKTYYFDPYIFKECHEIDKAPTKYWSYVRMHWISSVQFSLYGREGDVEALLLSQIYNSLWMEIFSYADALFQKRDFASAIWFYDEAIEMFKLAIESNHQYGAAYNSIWITITQKLKAKQLIKHKIPKNDYDAALLAFDKAIELFPLFQDISKNIGRVKSMSDPDWETIPDTGIDAILEEKIEKWLRQSQNAQYGDAIITYNEIIEYCDDLLKSNPKEQKIRTLKKETEEKKQIALYSLAYISREEWNISEADKYSQMARSL